MKAPIGVTDQTTAPPRALTVTEATNALLWRCPPACVASTVQTPEGRGASVCTSLDDYRAVCRRVRADTTPAATWPTAVALVRKAASGLLDPWELDLLLPAAVVAALFHLCPGARGAITRAVADTTAEAGGFHARITVTADSMAWRVHAPGRFLH